MVTAPSPPALFLLVQVQDSDPLNQELICPHKAVTTLAGQQTLYKKQTKLKDGQTLAYQEAVSCMSIPNSWTELSISKDDNAPSACLSRQVQVQLSIP